MNSISKFRGLTSSQLVSNINILTKRRSDLTNHIIHPLRVVDDTIKTAPNAHLWNTEKSGKTSFSSVTLTSSDLTSLRTELEEKISKKQAKASSPFSILQKRKLRKLEAAKLKIAEAVVTAEASGESPPPDPEQASNGDTESMHTNNETDSLHEVELPEENAGCPPKKKRITKNAPSTSSAAIGQASPTKKDGESNRKITTHQTVDDDFSFMEKVVERSTSNKDDEGNGHTTSVMRKQEQSDSGAKSESLLKIEIEKYKRQQLFLSQKKLQESEDVESHNAQKKENARLDEVLIRNLNTFLKSLPTPRSALRSLLNPTAPPEVNLKALEKHFHLPFSVILEGIHNTSNIHEDPEGDINLLFSLFEITEAIREQSAAKKHDNLLVNNEGLIEPYSCRIPKNSATPHKDYILAQVDSLCYKLLRNHKFNIYTLKYIEPRTGKISESKETKEFLPLVSTNIKLIKSFCTLQKFTEININQTIEAMNPYKHHLYSTL